MIIDRIETLDRRRKKIFADGEFAFALYLGEIRQLGLEEGGELAEELYQKILREIIFKRARERAVYWLKCSARTEEELRRKLRDNSYPPAAVDYVIDLLKQYRYIDSCRRKKPRRAGRSVKPERHQQRVRKQADGGESGG